mgnify:FL=1
MVYNINNFFNCMNKNTLKTTSEVNFGLSGRAIAQDLDKDLLDNLYHHLTMERTASVQYYAMSLWFQEKDLSGFSSFFLNESKDEMDHAYIFSDYLIARGQRVDLHEIAKPVQDWQCIKDVISYAFNMEADLSTSLQQLYSIAERSFDSRTSVFLDPIMEAQIKSEDEFAHILGQVKFSDEQPSAILIIDNELSKK